MSIENVPALPFSRRAGALIPPVLLCCVLGGVCPGAEKTAKTAAEKTAKTAAPAALTDAEIDARLETLFEAHADITRIHAAYEQVKTGGPFAEPVVEKGTLTYAAPDRIRLELPDPYEEGEMRLLLLDGTWFWSYDSFLGEAERYRVKSMGRGGKGWDLASLFVGSQVRSVAEIRDEFDITGKRAGDVVTLVLAPKADSERMAERIEMDLPAGAALPSRVRTVGAPDDTGERRATVRKLSGVKTNLDGLDPFPPETFLFPLDPDIIVIDKSGEKDRTVPAEERKAERAAALAAAADAADDPENVAPDEETPAP